MGRPQPDRDTVTAALELVAEGLSNREIADVFSVTEATIRGWAKKYGGAPKAPDVAGEIPAHMVEPTPPTPAAPLPDDPLALVRQLIAEQHAALERDRALGARGASSGAATLTKLVIAMKQLDADASKRGSDIHVTAAALAAADAELESRLVALSERPILCAGCSRALSVAWGLASDADPAAEPVIAKPGA